MNRPERTRRKRSRVTELRQAVVAHALPWSPFSPERNVKGEIPRGFRSFRNKSSFIHIACYSLVDFFRERPTFSTSRVIVFQTRLCSHAFLWCNEIPSRSTIGQEISRNEAFTTGLTDSFRLQSCVNDRASLSRQGITRQQREMQIWISLNPRVRDSWNSSIVLLFILSFMILSCNSKLTVLVHKVV